MPGSGLDGGDKSYQTAFRTASPSFPPSPESLCFPTPLATLEGTHGVDKKTEKSWFPTGSMQALQRQNCPPSTVPRPLGGRSLESCPLESAHAHWLLSEGLFWAEPLTCTFSFLVFTTTCIYRWGDWGAQRRCPAQSPETNNAKWDSNPVWGLHQTFYSTFLLPGRDKECSDALHCPSLLFCISVSKPGEEFLEKFKVNFAGSGLVTADFASPWSKGREFVRAWLLYFSCSDVIVCAAQSCWEWCSSNR